MTAIPLSKVLSAHNDDSAVAYYQGKSIFKQQFINDVAALYGKILNAESDDYWALYHTDAYPFSVALMALLYAAKNVIIPGDALSGTRAQISKMTSSFVGELGDDCLDVDVCVESKSKIDFDSMSASFMSRKIIIFTSGSTSEPKTIEKQLAQFDAEILTLEQCWGDSMQDSDIISTVSHQHIYGLLFKVLWPLCSQRIFYSESFLNPIVLLGYIERSAKKISWIASPAYLKRLDGHLGWADVKSNINCVFSSGGVLAFQTVEKIHTWLNVRPIEVFGSSETGGVAYRQCASEDSLWNTLPNVEIKTDGGNRLFVKSKHVSINDEWYETDDAVEITNGHAFKFLGRLDRIVKLEEKRLSLVELEGKILSSGCVQDVFCCVLTLNNEKLRQVLVATIVLNDNALSLANDESSQQVITLIKTHLKQYFELVLIPKKWKIVEALPLNSQSKINRQAVERLFN